jgi:ABC-type transport system involved in multi-copper enzyme maturation permease subunit
LYLLVALLALYFVQIGIDNYKHIISTKKEFQDFELLKVNQYLNYMQYGSYGFRILFIPSPLSTYFVNSSTISELTSNVDAGERLKIYNSFKGRTLFAEKSGGFKDFSGIMLLLGSLLVLYFGYESMINKDYLRFMHGFTSVRRLFFCVVFSRMVVIFFLFLFTAVISWLFLVFNNIRLTPSDYTHMAIYLGILMLMLVFFFTLGTITGSFKSRFVGFVILVVSWFVLVFLVPGIVSAVTSRRADNMTSNYQLELEKLKILMDFEKRSYEETGVTTEENIESVREDIERYMENEFKKVQAFEKKLAGEIAKNIRHFQTLSSLFPSTFYLSTSDEISSKGYESFIDFFSYILELKEKFIRYYINKRYYSNYSKVESFIKDDQNLFYAKSRLPRGFFRGLLLNLVFIVGLLIISYGRFKRSLRL